MLGLETGTIDFNLREVRVGAGLVPALGNHGGCPYRLLSLCIQSIYKRGDLRSIAVLSEEAGTIMLLERKDLQVYLVAQAMQGSKARTTRPTARSNSALMPSGPTYRFAATVRARRIASMLWTVGMTKSAVLIKPFSTS